MAILKKQNARLNLANGPLRLQCGNFGAQPFSDLRFGLVVEGESHFFTLTLDHPEAIRQAVHVARKSTFNHHDPAVHDMRSSAQALRDLADKLEAREFYNPV